ncbi:MAG: phage head morphogenesis protein, partial [Candidatus Binatia bacterium]
DEMHNSLTYWLTASYRANMAMDDTPVDEMMKRMRGLGKQWLKRFDAGSLKLAEWFALKNRSYTDATLMKILKDAGIAIDFKMTGPMRTAYSAVLHENVGLIKSIAERHLSEVEGLVLRSVQQGRNLGDLADELQRRYGLTRRRAALISRDQNNKATSAMNRARQLDLGIKQAVWKHSHAGRKPRPSHVAFNNHVYDVEKGAYLDGVWTHPGLEINCRCTSRSVLPGVKRMSI